MDAPDVIDHLLVVATSTLHRLKATALHVCKIIVVGIFVTGNAGVVAMYGLRKPGRIHVQ